MTPIKTLNNKYSYYVILDGYLLDSIDQVREIIDHCGTDYNNHSLNDSLEGISLVNYKIKKQKIVQGLHSPTDRPPFNCEILFIILYNFNLY